MQHIFASVVFLLAWAHCAAAQVQSVQDQTVQIIVEPKTSEAKLTLDAVIKDFRASVVNAGEAKVITVPTGRDSEFVAMLRSKAGPTATETFVLSQHYTSLFQPIAPDTLNPEQMEAVSKLRSIGSSEVMASPPVAFSEYALSKGFGRPHGLGSNNSVLLKIDDSWMQIYASKSGFEKAGQQTHTGTIRGQIGGTTLAVLNDGVRGFIQKGNDVFLVRPLGFNQEGMRVNAITKLTRPPVPFPIHEPSAPPIPMGKTMTGSPANSTIRILFAYTNQSEAWLKNSGLIWPTDHPRVFSPLLEDHLNDLATRSQAKVQYEHADSIVITYAQDLDFDRFLKKVTNREETFLEQVHTARQNAKANIVAIFVTVGEGCGHARQISASAATAFVVVLLSTNCLVHHTLAHEIGHLHGLVHDNHSDEPPPYPYAYGHRHNPTWRSPMATECRVGKDISLCPPLSWTNPDIPCPNSACRGDPFGSQRSNESKVLGKTAPFIAKF